MLTGAQKAHLRKGGGLSLVLAGEWMAPEIFTWNGQQFVQEKSNLGDLKGWWQTVTVGDLDEDGDDDLVLGNLGQNFYLHPDSTAPLRLWIRDFDNNGSREKILTKSMAGRDMPVFLKRELTEQVLSIKKQNLRYEDFGNKAIQDLFSAALLDSAMRKEITVMYSCIAYNEGGGRFTIQPLPNEMQWSSLHAFRLMDIDGDGKQDIVAGGNHFNFLPQFGRLDASFGHVLLQRGGRKWEEMNSGESGLFLRGQIRDIQPLTFKGVPHLLFIQNDDHPALMKLNSKGNK
jgi:hypothetical protein